jgi:hypothetical protein
MIMDAQVEAAWETLNTAAKQHVTKEGMRAALAAAQAGAPSHDQGDAAVHGRYWHEQGQEQGFAAGIEAAAQEFWSAWTSTDQKPSQWHLDTMARIRALRPPAAQAESEVMPIPVNLPFERIPQHADDPGYGPVPQDDNVAQIAAAPVEVPQYPTLNQNECALVHLGRTLSASKPPPPSASEPAGAPSEEDLAEVIARGMADNGRIGAARAVLALLRRRGKNETL